MSKRVTMTFRTDDLKNQLEALKLSLSKKGATRRAMYAAGAKIRDRARQLAPVRTGALKKAIVYRDNVSRDKTDPEMFYGKVTVSSGAFEVTARGKAKRLKKGAAAKGAKINPRKYAHLVEFGTSGHSVRKGSRKGSRPPLEKPHPGGKPRPFLRPALQTEASGAVDAFKESVKKSIEDVAAKRAR